MQSVTLLSNDNCCLDGLLVKFKIVTPLKNIYLQIHLKIVALLQIIKSWTKLPSKTSNLSNTSLRR